MKTDGTPDEWMAYADVDEDRAEDVYKWVVIIGSDDCGMHLMLPCWMSSEEDADAMAKNIAETLKYER